MSSQDTSTDELNALIYPLASNIHYMETAIQSIFTNIAFLTTSSDGRWYGVYDTRLTSFVALDSNHRISSAIHTVAQEVLVPLIAHQILSECVRQTSR